MVNFNAAIPTLLLHFLTQFERTFTKKAFISFCFYVSGLFLQLKRTNVQSISLLTPALCYENMQYFLSEAKWNNEELNDQRIQILQHNRTTKTSKKGVLVIDDSGCKKWGLKTEGAQVQHYGTEGTITRCNVVVTSAFVDAKKRYPINFRPYIPEIDPYFEKPFTTFKSKLQLAKELIEHALSKKLSFSHVLFDSWYLANHFVKFLNQKFLPFISELPVDRLISFQGKWTRADDLVKLIPPIKFNRVVTVSNSYGENKSFSIYSFKSKLKDLPGNFLFVVALGSWSKSDQKSFHVFITNHLAISPHAVIQKYSLRWGIECIFRDLKDNLYFDHFQVRSIHAINRHWHLTSLAYTFLLVSSLNGSFSRISTNSHNSCSQQLLLFRKLVSSSHLLWINLNKKSYQIYLGFKKPLRRAA